VDLPLQQTSLLEVKLPGPQAPHYVTFTVIITLAMNLFGALSRVFRAVQIHGAMIISAFLRLSWSSATSQVL
jgi:hypothetical protein